MKLRVFFILTICLLLNITSEAQTTRQELEKERKKVQQEIKKVNNLLFKTKKEKSNALDDLEDLNKKISVRKRLIKVINLEAKALSNEINDNEKEIKKLNKELAALKADYADMIYKSYKSKSQQSRTMFLLSSHNFLQAYKRLQYMKQYTSYRKKQGEALKKQTQYVQKLNDTLIDKKKQKQVLLKTERNEKKEIESDKKTQEKLISSIKKKEKSYKKKLQKKIKADQKLASRIDALIKEEIRKRNEEIARKNKTKVKPKSKNKFILSPEAKALAAKFEHNKGKLPRPIKKGLIIRKFGKQKHPTIPGIMINSTGIHIATEKGADTKSIFNGEIMAILKQSEGKKTVMVRHGNYISVYKNLETVYVHKGDKVTTGEQLGRIFTNKSDGKTTLIFVLLKDTIRLNPSHWIL